MLRHVAMFILSIYIGVQVIIFISHNSFAYLMVFLVVKMWHKNIVVVPKEFNMLILQFHVHEVQIPLAVKLCSLFLVFKSKMCCVCIMKNCPQLHDMRARFHVLIIISVPWRL